MEDWIRSLKEYLPAVIAQSVVILLALVSVKEDVRALAEDLNPSLAKVPKWVWAVLLVCAVFAAPFYVFHQAHGA